MRKNSFDIELRKSILKYLEAGHGYKKIAKDFNINVYTAKYIRDIYRRGDLSYFEGNDTFKYKDGNEKLAIVRRYLDSGLPLKTFAREEGLNPQNLRNWFEKYHEGDIDNFSQEKHKWLNISEKIALVQQFLNSGQPLKTFAQSENLNPLTLKGWVLKYHEGELQHKKRTRRDLSEKLAFVEAYLASDQPLKTFAESEGISTSTLRNWVLKYQEGTLLKSK